MKTNVYSIVLDKDADIWRVYRGDPKPENEIGYEAGIDDGLALCATDLLDNRDSFPDGYKISVLATRP